MKWLYVSLFIAIAGLSWGVYVPLVHKAAGPASADGSGGLGSNLRAFLMVGIAYFLVAVLVPCIFIFITKSDPTIKGNPAFNPNFNQKAVIFGLLAGMVGAAGALGVIFASTTAGKDLGPLIVPPILFSVVPIVNTIATLMYFHPVRKMPDWRFFMGIGMAVLGAVMVMVFKPREEAHAAPLTETVAASTAGTVDNEQALLDSEQSEPTQIIGQGNDGDTLQD